MGVSIAYQAIPENSELFDRLRTDKKISHLFIELFFEGRGPFFIDELYKLYPDELNEILDWMASKKPSLGKKSFTSRPEVDRYLKDILILLEATKANYPGVENRAAYLEKTQYVIEKKLSEKLKENQLDGSLEKTRTLLYGSELLAPKLFGKYEQKLSLIPSKEVKKGAELLEDIKAIELFLSSEEEYYRDVFEQWKNLYLQASSLDEAILVGTSG